MNDISILLVDDELYNTDIVAMALRTDGYRVFKANSGHKALDILHTNKIDLIITDIAMPGMNGYQLLEYVRQQPALIPIPVFFLTARSMDSDINYGKTLGVEGYLTKPLDVKGLLASVKGALLRVQQLSQVKQEIAQIPSEKIEIHTYGRLHINLDERVVLLDQYPLSLSVKQFDFLSCLVEHAYTAVSYEELICITHKLKLDRTEASSLARPIARRLRDRLAIPPNEPGWIQTVRGFGYRLLLPEV